MVVNRLALVGSLLLASVFAHAQAPIDMLRKSMERRCTIAANLIQSQLMPHDKEGVRTVVRISQDRHGRMRRTVLQPIRMQGVVSVDDGKNWMMVMPDDKVAILQPSPPKSSVRLRTQLIEKNYRLSAERGDDIAGRATVAIVCRPLAEGFAARRITLDSKTFLMLRSEVLREGAKPEMILDTHWVEYPDEVDASLFSTAAPEGYRLSMKDRNPSVRSAQEAEKLAGFAPKLPGSLPYGFAVDRIDIISAAPKGMVALRLTDGFSTLTAYQWDPAAKPNTIGRGQAPTQLIRLDGLEMMVMGDIPRAALQRIIEFLIKQAQIGWDQEPQVF